MALSAVLQWCFVAMMATLVQQSEAACKDLKPPGNFTTDMLRGQRYLAGIKKVYNFPELENKCHSLYSHTDNKKWQFVAIYEYSNKTDDFSEYYGDIAGPGNFKIKDRPTTDGSKVSYTWTVLAGANREYALLYSCNAKKGDYGLWVYYKKRVQSFKELPNNIKADIVDALDSYSLDVKGLGDADNKNCVNQ